MEKRSISKAMRKGIECSEPAIGAFFIESGMDGKCQTCALGAAIFGALDCSIERMASHQKFIGGMVSSAEQLFGIMDQAYEIDPVSKYATEKSVWWIIIDLNDTHDWTREQIADWLESVGR